MSHTVILHDPFEDPKDLPVPARSPSPSEQMLKSSRIGIDEKIDPDADLSDGERQTKMDEKEAKARAHILEMIGDLHDADDKPPDNVLFVCKLNPVTVEDDLEIIFGRFGKIKCCEVYATVAVVYRCTMRSLSTRMRAAVRRPISRWSMYSSMIDVFMLTSVSRLQRTIRGTKKPTKMVQRNLHHRRHLNMLAMVAANALANRAGRRTHGALNTHHIDDNAVARRVVASTDDQGSSCTRVIQLL